MLQAKVLVLVIICCALLGCAGGAPDVSPLVGEQPETGVIGQVSSAGTGAAASLWVYAYHSQQGRFRGPADFASRVGADGRYLLDLPPGRWFLVARSRQQGPLSGPPQAGDAWAIYPGNPVLLEPQQVQRIDLQLRAVGPSMSLRSGMLGQGTTGFKGRLLGPGEVPVAGAVALAYADQDYHRMPDHSSAAVTEDGRFTLYVAEPGRYCLAARQGTRGQPRQGELYGLLGSGAAACREVGRDEMHDVGAIYLTPYLR